MLRIAVLVPVWSLALGTGCSPEAPPAARAPAAGADSGAPATPGAPPRAREDATTAPDLRASDAPAQPDGPAAVDSAAPGQPAPDVRAPVADAPPPGLDTGASAPRVDPPASQPNLPVLWIDVRGQRIGDTKVTGSLKVITDHDGSHRDLAARPAELSAPIGISVRGSSSRGWPQKSFGIELRDAAGMAVEKPVLGFAPDSDWGALACWADKTCMRNAVAYSINRALPGARWNPAGRWVEVFVDGQYNGLYWFTELVRRGKHRVNVPRPAPDAASGDLTGGYIVSREEGGKANPATTNPPTDFALPMKGPDGYVMVYTYRYPNEREITSAQREYLKTFYTRFNTMMASADWSDPDKGYRRWMDVPSAVDYALVHELTADVDSYWKSMYYAKEPDALGGKIVVAPQWDFNLSFGNSLNRQSWKYDGLVVNRDGGWCYAWLPGYMSGCNCDATPACWNSPFVSFYWHKIWRDPAFLRDLKCRWRTLRAGTVDPAAIDARIAGWKRDLMTHAIPRHFARWPALRRPVDPNPCDKVSPSPCGSPTAPIAEFYDHEVASLRGWIGKRIAWLDANLPGTCDR